MATASIRARAVGTGATATPVVTLPTVQTDDLLVTFISTRGGTTYTASTGGWTFVVQVTRGGAGGSLSMLTRRATSSDAAGSTQSLPTNGGTGTTASWIAQTFSISSTLGVDVAVGSADTNTSATPHIAPSAVTTQDGEPVLRVIMSALATGTRSYTWDSPATTYGTTNRADATGNASHSQTSALEAGPAPAGNTGTRNATPNGGQSYGAITVAFLPSVITKKSSGTGSLDTNASGTGRRRLRSGGLGSLFTAALGAGRRRKRSGGTGSLMTVATGDGRVVTLYVYQHLSEPLVGIYGYSAAGVIGYSASGDLVLVKDASDLLSAGSRTGTIL